MSNALYKIPIALSGLANAGKYLVVDDDGYNFNKIKISFPW